MKTKAFTLVEILIALSILAVLSALALPKYLSFRRAAQIKVAEAQAQTYRKALGLMTANMTPAELSTLFGGNTLASSATNFYPTLLSYIDSDTLRLQPPQVYSSGANTALYTPSMQAIAGNNFATQYISGTAVAGIGAVGCAHMIIYWDIANRATTEPTLLLFTPQ